MNISEIESPVPVPRRIPQPEIEETIGEVNESEFQEDEEYEPDEEDTPAATVLELDENTVTNKSSAAKKLRSGRVSKKKQNTTLTIDGVLYHPCEECGKTFTTPSGRSRHKCSQKSVNCTIAIKCDLCTKTFTTTAGRTKHMKIKHNPLGNSVNNSKTTKDSSVNYSKTTNDSLGKTIVDDSTISLSREKPSVTAPLQVSTRRTKSKDMTLSNSCSPAINAKKKGEDLFHMLLTRVTLFFSNFYSVQIHY